MSLHRRSTAPIPQITSYPPRRRLLGMTLFSVFALAVTSCATFADSGPSFSGSPTLTPNVATVIPPDGMGAGAAAEPGPPNSGAAPSSTASGAPADPCVPPELPVVAVCLDSPWGLAPLPSGDSALVGERTSGRILTVQANEPPQVVATINGLDASHGGGLLGLALSPYYGEDGLIYAYVTTPTDARVLRLALGQQPKPIVTGLPVGSAAVGGDLFFDADGLLYITAPGPAKSSTSKSSTVEGGTTKSTRASSSTKSPRSQSSSTPPSSSTSSGAPRGSAASAVVLRVDSFGLAAKANSSHTAVFADGFTDPTGMCLLPGGGVGVLDHRTTGDVLIAIKDGGSYRTLSSGDSVWTYSPGDGGATDCAIAGGALIAPARSKPHATTIQLRPGGGFTGAPEEILDGDYGLLRTAVPGPGDLVWLTTANKQAGASAGGPAKGSASSDDRVIALPPSSAGDGGGVD
ncbi:MAG: PQQ-dependent sugar dehydrogenase [Nakamurella sp.]